jgi:hypothetical protein
MIERSTVMRRLYVRQAGGFLATAVLGFTLLFGSAVSVSAMPCGPIKDPVTGQIINYIICRETISKVKPEPCICPDYGTIKYDPEYDPRAVYSQVAVSQEVAAPQLKGGMATYGP